MHIKRLLASMLTLLAATLSMAWEGGAPPALHVDGRYFKDPSGNIVTLHGYAQTYSPWFNERGTKWSNYDVAACLAYNRGLVDKIKAAGWKMDFVRLHMDPYWSNTPGKKNDGEADISAFSFERFKKYLDEVFVPMAQYIVAQGMYVVMRPPGVCPQKITPGDAYQQYLIKVWDHVAQHPALRDNPCVMFELANEPVSIVDAAGQTLPDRAMTDYIQPVVDAIRAHCRNIVLVPGLGWQARYAAFADYPVRGENVGYAVHCYPGWYNGAHDQSKEVVVDYDRFKAGWAQQVGPVSRIAPVVVTEMDWAPVKYDDSWGKSTTGTVGGTGFGANFKDIVDRDGNVSWLVFTWPHILARYDGVPASPADTTIVNDPEACVWPCYQWFADYAKTDYPATAPYGATLSRGRVTGVRPAQREYVVMPSSRRALHLLATYEDGTEEDVTASSTFALRGGGAVLTLDRWAVAGEAEGSGEVEAAYDTPDGRRLTATIPVSVRTFPLVAGAFNPSIWEQGTFDEATGKLHTGQWGFGGWEYGDGIDLSAYRYLVVELQGRQSASASFRLFDEPSYWSKFAAYNFGSETRLVIDLHAMVKDGTATPCNPAHIYRAGFWTTGGAPIYIKDVYLSQDGQTSTGIALAPQSAPAAAPQQGVYSLDGRLVRRGNDTRGLKKGVYVVGGKKVVK